MSSFDSCTQSYICDTCTMKKCTKLRRHGKSCSTARLQDETWHHIHTCINITQHLSYMNNAVLINTVINKHDSAA